MQGSTSRLFAVALAACAAALLASHVPGRAQDAGVQPDVIDDVRRAAVVATFAGGRITVGELEDAITNKLPRTRARLSTSEGRVEMLRAMVDYELLIQEAARRGYAEHPRVRDAGRQAAIDALFGVPRDVEEARRIEADMDAAVVALRKHTRVESSPELVDLVVLDRRPRRGLAGHRIIPRDPRAAPKIVAQEEEGGF